MPTDTETKLVLTVEGIIAFPPFTHSVVDCDRKRALVALFTNSEDAYDFIRRKTETPSDAVDRALGTIRRDYHGDVHDAAVSIQEELLGRLKQQECGEPLREWLAEHIDETIDGCARVIYTRQAQLGVLCSDNDGAYFEEFGDEGAVADGAIDWSKLCYAAMHQDVIEELERIEVDANNPVPPCVQCDADDQDERFVIGDDDTNIDGDLVCGDCKLKAGAIARIRTLTLDQCRALCLDHGITLDEPAELEAVRAGLIDDIAEGKIDPTEVPA